MKVFIGAIIVITIVLGLFFTQCSNKLKKAPEETAVEKVVENSQDDNEFKNKALGFEVVESFYLLNSGAWSAITLVASKKGKICAVYEHMLDPNISKNFGHGLYFVRERLGGGMVTDKEIHLDSDDNIMIISNYRANEFYNCYDEDNKEICDAEALEVEKWKGIIKWDKKIPKILEKRGLK